MARMIGGIVEARIRPSKKDPTKAEEINLTFNRTVNAVVKMIGKSINGHVIGGLHTDPLYGEMLNHYRHIKGDNNEGEPLCIVPDFGHNLHCQCLHKNETPFGVLRLFGLHNIAIEGYPDADKIFGTYEINEDTRISISSVSCLVPSDNPVELCRISD